MKNLIIEDVLSVYNNYGFITKKIYCKYGKYKSYEIKKHFNSFNELINEINKNNVNLVLINEVSKDDLVNDVLNIFNKLNGITSKDYIKYGKYEYDYITKYFGGFNAIKMELNLQAKKYSQLTKLEIIDLGKSYYKETNSIKFMEFIKSKNISYTNFKNEFNNFEEFLKLCNLQKQHSFNKKKIQSEKLINNNNSKKTDKKNLNKEDIEKIIMEFSNGKVITCGELYSKTILTQNDIIKHFVSFNQMKNELKLINIYEKDTIKPLLKKLYDKNCKLTREIINENYSYKKILKLFDSHKNIFVECNIPINNYQYKNVNKEELLNDCKSLFDTYGLITKNILDNYGKYSSKIYFEKIGNIDCIYKHLNLINYKGSFKAANSLEVLHIVSNILKEECEFEKTFSWLKYENNSMYIDGYFKSSNLAIEYNGIQHYKHIEYFDKDIKSFERRKDRDRVKYELLRKNNIKLIVIDYNDMIDEDNLRIKLQNCLDGKNPRVQGI